MTEELRGAGKEVLEKGVIPLILSSLPNSSGLLINATETTEKLSVKDILNKAYEEISG